MMGVEREGSGSGPSPMIGANTSVGRKCYRCSEYHGLRGRCECARRVRPRGARVDRTGVGDPLRFLRLTLRCGPIPVEERDPLGLWVTCTDPRGGRGRKGPPDGREIRETGGRRADGRERGFVSPDGSQFRYINLCQGTWTRRGIRSESRRSGTVVVGVVGPGLSTTERVEG